MSTPTATRTTSSEVLHDIYRIVARMEIDAQHLRERIADDPQLSDLYSYLSTIAEHAGHCAEDTVYTLTARGEPNPFYPAEPPPVGTGILRIGSGEYVSGDFLTGLALHPSSRAPILVRVWRREGCGIPGALLQEVWMEGHEDTVPMPADWNPRQPVLVRALTAAEWPDHPIPPGEPTTEPDHIHPGYREETARLVIADFLRYLQDGGADGAGEVALAVQSPETKRWLVAQGNPVYEEDIRRAVDGFAGRVSRLRG